MRVDNVLRRGRNIYVSLALSFYGVPGSTRDVPQRNQNDQLPGEHNLSLTIFFKKMLYTSQNYARE